MDGEKLVNNSLNIRMLNESTHSKVNNPLKFLSDPNPVFLQSLR